MSEERKLNLAINRESNLLKGIYAIRSYAYLGASKIFGGMNINMLNDTEVSRLY